MISVHFLTTIFEEILNVKEQKHYSAGDGRESLPVDVSCLLLYSRADIYAKCCAMQLNEPYMSALSRCEHSAPI